VARPTVAGVLRLLARGLSNAEIACELWLGEATMKTRFSRVLAKLPSRSGAGGGAGVRVRSREGRRARHV